MGDIEKGFILGFLTGVFMTALLLGWLLGISREDDCREAIRHGAAEYYINTNTLEKEFRWKDRKMGWIPIEVRSENPTNMFYNCKMWGEIK